MRVTLLGTGSSGGVPFIGCKCGVCTSSNPKNRRSRVSVYVETPTTKLVIDTGPDFKSQMLAQDISVVDAVLYTHDHADHTHGIDDLRAFNYLMKKPVEIHADSATITCLRERFAYVFLPPPDNVWMRPSVVPNIIKPYQQFTVGDVSIIPFTQHHGNESETLGFRIGDFAYSTDVSGFPDASWEVLKGVKTWVIDCLRYKKAPTHAHLDLTLEWIERIKPKRAILTHMNHDMEYETLYKMLPPGVEPGYDGFLLDNI